MRKSGILLHISSLPGKYGIGSFGKEAYKFVDKLKLNGKKILMKELIRKAKSIIGLQVILIIWMMGQMQMKQP